MGQFAQSVQRLAMSWTVQGSNTSRDKIFRTCSDRPWGPPGLLYNGYRVFHGAKERPGHDADPSPPSSAMVMIEQNYTSTPPVDRTACTEPQCLYRVHFFIQVYIVSSHKLWYTLLGTELMFLFLFFFHVSRVLLGGASRSYIVLLISDFHKTLNILYHRLYNSRL